MNERLVAEVVRRVVGELERRGTLPDSGAAAAPSAARVAAALPADWPPRRVAIGADHGGFELKEDLKSFLSRKGWALEDCGTSGPESCDYPDLAAAVARRVADGRCQAGIVIDGAGIGSAMAANKVPGVRCAVCHDVATVLNSREHNDANVLSLGAGVVPAALARRMAELWLRTPHGGGRHLRRVAKVMEIEGWNASS